MDKFFVFLKGFVVAEQCLKIGREKKLSSFLRQEGIKMEELSGLSSGKF